MTHMPKTCQFPQLIFSPNNINKKQSLIINCLEVLARQYKHKRKLNTQLPRRVGEGQIRCMVTLNFLPFPCNFEQFFSSFLFCAWLEMDLIGKLAYPWHVSIIAVKVNITHFFRLMLLPFGLGATFLRKKCIRTGS